VGLNVSAGEFAECGGDALIAEFVDTVLGARAKPEVPSGRKAMLAFRFLSCRAFMFRNFMVGAIVGDASDRFQRILHDGCGTYRRQAENNAWRSLLTWTGDAQHPDFVKHGEVHAKWGTSYFAGYSTSSNPIIDAGFGSTKAAHPYFAGHWPGYRSDAYGNDLPDLTKNI
jgi:hypothetical protein